MILEGSTADKMQDIYTRPHRNSIYEPATIHDIPYEVLRESFLYLFNDFDSDLASQSLACRAWRVVAVDLMNSHKNFFDGGNVRIESNICGLHLQTIVGLESCTIKHLTIDLLVVAEEYIDILARYTSTTLSILALCFVDRGDQSSDCYEALNVVFKQCDGIQNLKLEYFDFGDDPASFSQNVMDGFSRLNQLNLVDCEGDIRTFVEKTPIPNLKILYYESRREAAEDEEIISSLASIYRTLTSVKLFAKFESSASLLKVVECCRDLEILFFYNFFRRRLILNRSDIIAVASLPRLKCLDIGIFSFTDDASSALVRCKGLNELRLPSLADPAILEAIGSNLVNLELWRPSKEVVDGIVKHCPNLRYLELGSFDEVDEEVKEVFVGSIRNGLKKLAKLKVNNESIRLGTGWEGYE
jgi:hypothetical protein